MLPVIPAVVLALVSAVGARWYFKNANFKELCKWGEDHGCPYVPGENEKKYRERLISLRNENISDYSRMPPPPDIMQ